MLAKNLKKFRKSAGLTQETLAQKSGVSYNAVIKLEQGMITNPTLDTLTKIANVFNVELDELVGRKIRNKGVSQNDN